jgi:hypothetical protein
MRLKRPAHGQPWHGAVGDIRRRSGRPARVDRKPSAFLADRLRSGPRAYGQTMSCRITGIRKSDVRLRAQAGHPAGSGGIL